MALTATKPPNEATHWTEAAMDDTKVAEHRVLHAADLNRDAAVSGSRVVAFDGKLLKGSFDSFNDAKAKQVLSAFAVDTALVLAHIEIDDKSNEIPAVQKLLEELDVAGHIVTCDAMHCQKKPLKPRQRRTRI